MSRRVCCAIIEFFIRPNGPETKLDSVVMRGPPLLFAATVKFHPEPTGVTANPFANYGRVLADAACNTSASRLPMSAATEPSSRPMR